MALVLSRTGVARADPWNVGTGTLDLFWGCDVVLGYTWYYYDPTSMHSRQERRVVLGVVSCLVIERSSLQWACRFANQPVSFAPSISARRYALSNGGMGVT